MQLILDHTQRLNLHALMGAQRASVDEVRIWWRLQDRIELTEEEKHAIGYRVQQVQTANGVMDQPTWGVDKSIPPRSFEFAAEDFRRIEKLVKEWQPGFLATADRRWLEPLLEQLAAAGGSVNGQPATLAPALQ